MVPGGHGLHVADTAAGLVERSLTCHDLSVGDGAVGGHGRRRREEAHEIREVIHVIDHFLRLGQLVVDGVLGRGHNASAGGGVLCTSLAALIGKQFVGNALLHVVGLPGEDDQRLVLRLPTEAGNGAVVAVAIGVPGDTE